MGSSRNLTQAIRLILALGAVSAAGVTAANAQVVTATTSSTTTTETNANSGLEEVVVTGTRILRPDYEAAAPVVTVSQEYLTDSGAVSLVDKLNALPQLTPDVSSSSNNPGNGGFANANLRGLGPTRTLVLIDGRRAMPQDSSGVVDLNTIPEALIDHIELLTAGASSSYGSDAIAGVVNVIMKRNFEGVEVDGGYGWDAHSSDGKTRSFAATIGANFADGKGNSVITLAYDNRDAVFQGARPFSAVTLGPSLSAQGSSTLPGGRERNWFGNNVEPDAVGANRPTQAAFDAVFGTYGFAPGTCLHSDAVGFNPNGSLYCRNGANAGANLTPGQTGIVVGGGAVTYNYGAVNYLQLPESRKQIFQDGHYDINDNVEVYDQFYFTSYSSTQVLAATPVAPFSQVVDGTVITPEFTVPANNPLVLANPALAALLASRADPTAPFAFSRRTIELGTRDAINSNNVYQGLIGVKGNFEVSDHRVDWNVYGSYGYGSEPTEITGDISVSAFQGLLNGTTTVGSCSQANFNPFGLGNISAACAAAIGESNLFTQVTTQSNWEGTVQTDVIKLLSNDPVKVLLGGDWRRNTFDFEPDYPSQTGDAYGINSGPVPPVQGQNDVKEGFLELSMPIIADLPGIKRLDVDLSYRYSDYTLGGPVSTYGGTLDYKPIQQVAVRSSYAHAARAPTLADLFAGPSSGSPAYSDPCDTSNGALTPQVQALCIKQGVPAADYAAGGGGYTAPNQQVQATLSGNKGLKPETSDSFTFGVVFSTVFAGDQQFNTSVDFWHYIVKNQISTVGANTTLALCFDQNGANPTYDPTNTHCSQVQRNANGDVENIFDPDENLGDLKTAGIDWQLSYGLPLSTMGLPDGSGKLTFNINASFLMESEYQQLQGGTYINTKGTISDVLGVALNGAEPDVKAIAQLGYSIAGVTATWQSQFIDHMKAINDDGSAVEFGTAPGTPSYVIHQLSVGYKLNGLSLVGGCANLFNKQPPIYTTDSQAGIQANTDPSSFDTLGRRFYVNASYKF